MMYGLDAVPFPPSNGILPLIIISGLAVTVLNGLLSYVIDLPFTKIAYGANRELLIALPLTYTVDNA